MNTPDGIRVERVGFATVYLSAEVPAQELLHAIAEEGFLIKDGDKRRVRLVQKKWIVKSTQFNGGLSALKISVNRNRYRNGWLASLELARLGILVPKTVAYIEHRLFGVIWNSTLVYDFQDGQFSAIEYLRDLIAANNSDAIEVFSVHLAQALDALAAAKVCHHDLKLANILTSDGREFYFIDLDEAHTNQPFHAEHRLRNHIQIAGGMSTVWNEAGINAFLARGIPDGENPEEWIARVWAGVHARTRSGEIH